MSQFEWEGVIITQLILNFNLNILEKEGHLKKKRNNIFKKSIKVKKDPVVYEL